MPATVGRYQITERISRGAMTEVFKGIIVGEFGFQKQIAVKRLVPAFGNERALVEIFLDEARVAARLAHKNLLEVLELGNDAGTHFLAMQFVDGVTLGDVLRQPIPVELAALIAREVLDALDYAHNATDGSGLPLDVIHRDISPRNVLVSTGGDVKLIDFGPARDRSTRGTPGYLSPEQVSGDRIDARSDIFQVGILLAEMVLGRRLFAAASEVENLLSIRDATVGVLDTHGDTVPVALLDMIRRALRRDPEQRWQTAAAFREAIDEWLHETARVGRRELAALVLTKEAVARPSAIGSGAMKPMRDEELSIPIEVDEAATRRLMRPLSHGDAFAQLGLDPSAFEQDLDASMALAALEEPPPRPSVRFALGSSHGELALVRHELVAEAPEVPTRTPRLAWMFACGVLATLGVAAYFFA